MKAQNYLGQVGELISFKTPEIEVSLTEYSIGDCIGGKIELNNALRVSNATGMIKRLLLRDASGSAPVVDILVFSSEPTVATVTDNAPIDLGTDINKVIRTISVTAEDYITVGTDSVADILLEDLYVYGSNTRDIWLVISAVGVVTFTLATDLGLTATIQRN